MEVRFMGDLTMIKKIAATLVLGLALMGGQAYAADAPATGTANPTEMMNPFAWMGVMNSQPNVQRMNLARPEGYTVFMNPMNYPQFMNPATYGQFMTPQFYMQFADPNNMMAWMNPAAYSAYMNPSTYMNMMNPMAYMQFMNPGIYMQPMNPANYGVFMDPNTYMAWMNPNAYVPGAASTASMPYGGTSFNWFDPNAWTGMMTPQQPQQQAPAQ